MNLTLKLFNMFYKITPDFLRKPLKFLYTIMIELLKPMKKFLTPMMGVLTPTIIQKMKKETDKIFNIYDAVEFSFSFKFLTFSIKPSQVKYEITKLLELLKDLKPKTILEIGTERGGTLFLFTSIADPEATILSVDLLGGPFGGGYPEWKIPLYQSFARNEQKIKLLRGDSHNAKTFELVKTTLDGKVDFLFVDGDHTYEGIKKDFEMYSPLVREGGLIAFHDIIEHPPETGCNVNKFWNEIKYDYKYIEIIEDIKQDWAGIGVIYL